LYADTQEAVLDRAKFNTAKPYKKTIPSGAKEDAATIINVLPPFRNIRYFSFVKEMYLEIF
jgi:hypothetical protein